MAQVFITNVCPSVGEERRQRLTEDRISRVRADMPRLNKTK